jgi:hypothetical protein
MKVLFYSRSRGDFVVDEMCRCGHLKSKHGSLIHKTKNAMIRDPSDGSCCSDHCECGQFTFVEFVTISDLQKAGTLHAVC